MWDYKTPSDEWIYLYTADDERAWSYKTDNTSLWTLRGLDAKVLREYTTNGTWSVAEDYIYRDGLLLAAETPAGTRHFHLDHLGTPRLVSNNLGQQAAYHVYYPFGEEATAFNQDTIRAKFTGHERDLGNTGGAGDDLDYMHARHESEWTGRFLSPDPESAARRKKPQSWNRYAYVLNNPGRFVDPDGRTEREGWEASVIVNNSSEVIWIAGDVNNKTYVIPLSPGESSTAYFVDADAVVIDPGEVGPEGASIAPSIEGKTSGAFKIGISVVSIEDSGPMDLTLNASVGYVISSLLGRGGFLDVNQGKQEGGWVMPKDRKAAETIKQQLHKRMEDKKKKEEAEKKKREIRHRTKPPV
jgi:RHS repeat-associated protein